jgi:hypothetical protein
MDLVSQRFELTFIVRSMFHRAINQSINHESRTEVLTDLQVRVLYCSGKCLFFFEAIMSLLNNTSLALL